jgi:hypothetical protein
MNKQANVENNNWLSHTRIFQWENCDFHPFEIKPLGFIGIGNSSYRLNFDLGKMNKIHHHS